MGEFIGPNPEEEKSNPDWVEIRAEHAKSETPVLVAPAWSITPNTMRGMLETVSERGRDVYSLAHPRNKEYEDISFEMRGKKGDKPYPAEAFERALNILDTFEKMGAEKIDAIGYSEGAIDLVTAAAIKPEKFRNIVLVAPGGVVGKDTFPRLAGRFSLTGIRSAYRNFRDKSSKEFIEMAHAEGSGYVKENRGRALREAVGISRAEIQELLSDLKEKGIGIGIVALTDDKVFPMERMQKTVSSENIDGFVSVSGSHEDLTIHPDKFAIAAESLLTSLEKKNK